MNCPNCRSRDIHDGYPEAPFKWVCVNCGHLWRQRAPQQSLLDLGGQEEHLERVATRIGKAVREFCSDHAQFHAEDLREFIRQECGQTAPASADRILRDLRKRGVINYVVLNRRSSLYEVKPV